MATITTILQLYKRPYSLTEQLKAIQAQSVKSNYLFIVHNEGGEVFDIPAQKNVSYFYAKPNQKFHFRYVVALLAKTDYVSMLDDDVLPQKNWYKNCLDTIKEFNCICVSNGRIVDRANNKQYGMGWGVPNDEPRRVDFGGHSLFFKKDVLKHMWRENILNFDNGEDIMLSANSFIYGNIKTYVPKHPILDRTLWGADPELAMKWGSDSVASWIVRKDVHTLERFKLINEYVKKGWSLLLEENK